MKKISFIILSLFILASPFFFHFNNIQSNPSNLVYADLEEDFNDILDDQLSDLDLSNIEEIIADLNGSEKDVFGGKSFLEKIYMILSGDFSNDFSSIWDLLASLIFGNILSFLPIIATIIAISILGGMVGNLRPQTNGKSIGNIIHFIIYGVIVVLLSSIIIKMITLTSHTLNAIQNQVDVIFPVLLTLLTALGGSVSVSIFQPAIAILSSFVVQLFTNFLLPLFLISLAFNFISNLSNSVKLDKLSNFTNSLFKWVIGIVFTLFTGFISIQGLAAGAIDGLSIKTAKFTIKSSLPLIGSYISDGLFLILASTNLIKNAVGGAGLLLLLATVLSPLIQLIFFVLALKLIAGIIEPLGDAKIANFISILAKNMSMLIVMIVSVSFMYLVLTGLVMCSANII